MKKNKDEKKIKRTVTSLFELPKEVVLNLPLISLIGNDEMRIENYKGVIEYSEERVRIGTACGVLKVEGKKLFLKQITDENIVVSGVLSKFEFLV